jgi:hypothetical protein
MTMSKLEHVIVVGKLALVELPVAIGEGIAGHRLSWILFFGGLLYSFFWHFPLSTIAWLYLFSVAALARSRVVDLHRPALTSPNRPNFDAVLRASPKQKLALLYHLKIYPETIERILQKCREAGFVVLSAAEVSGKEYLVKSLYEYESPDKYFDESLRRTLVEHVKCQGETAVISFLDSLNIDYGVLPLLQPLLSRHGYYVIPRTVLPGIQKVKL